MIIRYTGSGPSHRYRHRYVLPLCCLSLLLIQTQPHPLLCDGFVHVMKSKRFRKASSSVSFERGTTHLIPPSRKRSLQHSPSERDPTVHRSSIPNPLFISLSSGVLSTMTLSNSKVYCIGGAAGIVALLCQCGLTKFLKQYKRRKDIASYTAHTIIALVFMMYVSVVGCIGWFMSSSGSSPITPFDRLVLPNEQCRCMASIVTGVLLLWDLPTSMYVKSLRKLDVIVHHIVMTLTAYFATTILPMYYVYFYFGVSELSSIPLLLYDQLCIMIETLNTSPSIPVHDNSTKLDALVVDDNNAITSDELIDKQTNNELIQLRDSMQIVAAVSFTIVRAILFTYVTVRHFIPDVRSVIRLVQLPSSMITVSSVIRPVQMKTLRFAFYASIGFTVLQLYWFLKMLRTIYQQTITIPSNDPFV
jgi:hypothetical protein